MACRAGTALVEQEAPVQRFADRFTAYYMTLGQPRLGPIVADRMIRPFWIAI